MAKKVTKKICSCVKQKFELWEGDDFCTECGQKLVEITVDRKSYCERCGRHLYKVEAVCPERLKPWWSSWSRLEAKLNWDNHSEHTVSYFSRSNHTNYGS